MAITVAMIYEAVSMCLPWLDKVNACKTVKCACKNVRKHSFMSPLYSFK